MRYKLLYLVLLLEILVVSAPILRATDLRGDVVGLADPMVGVGVSLFEVKPNKKFRLVRQTVTAPNGSITLTTFIPANTLYELVESITRSKSAKRKCKTFRLLHHRIIELSTPSTTNFPQQMTPYVRC